MEALCILPIKESLDRLSPDYISQNFFLRPITDYRTCSYKKDLNNNCLRNIIPAIFHTYILAEQLTPQKLMQYLHFLKFRYTFYPKYLHL